MPADFERLYPLVFFSTALALIALEQVGALRRQPVSVATRWTSNIGLYLIGGLVAVVVLPIGGGGLLLVGAGSLALGIWIARRKRKR